MHNNNMIHVISGLEFSVVKREKLGLRFNVWIILWSGKKEKSAKNLTSNF